jgi:hypothetical protein
MGRAREKKANRMKVSLYIVKRRLRRARKVPGGICRRIESRVRMRRDATV